MGELQARPVRRCAGFLRYGTGPVAGHASRGACPAEPCLILQTASPCCPCDRPPRPAAPRAKLSRSPMPEPTPTPAPMSATRAITLRLTLMFCTGRDGSGHGTCEQSVARGCGLAAEKGQWVLYTALHTPRAGCHAPATAPWRCVEQPRTAQGTVKAGRRRRRSAALER